jgi:hypothetical protein
MQLGPIKKLEVSDKHTINRKRGIVDLSLRSSHFLKSHHFNVMLAPRILYVSMVINTQ